MLKPIGFAVEAALTREFGREADPSECNCRIQDC
jgi:hypothetical protein